MPACSESVITQDDVDNSGSMNGRVRVHGSSNLLHSRLNLAGFSWVCGKERDTTGSLTIKAEILGEGLEEADSLGLLGEESKRISIGLEITTGKSLIGTIEGREVVLSLDDL